MRHGLLGIGLLLLSAAPAAHAHWYDPPATLHTGPTLDLGYSFGGDDLDRPDLIAGHKDISGAAYAGEGLSAGIGMLEWFGQDWGLGMKQEVGIFEHISGDGGSWDGSQPDYTKDSIGFQHSYFNFLVFIHSDTLAFGGGSVLQTDVQEMGGKVWDGTFADFENAHGWLLMFQYRALSIRYTHIQYRVKHVASSPPVDGNNVGIYLSWQFF